MALTQAQKTSLKTDILSPANAAALSGFIAGEDWPSVAIFYNSVGAGLLWRPNIQAYELTGVVVGSAFDVLPVAKQNGYLVLIHDGIIDATQASIRAWFSDIFGAGATLTALTAKAQRPGTRVELLFSVPAGAANVSALFGIQISASDVQDAMLHG